MQPNLKAIAAWVAALRLGHYSQGMCALRRHRPGLSDRYDILGVACDVADPDGWTLLPGSDLYAHHGGTGYLPLAVVEHYGLPADPHVTLGCDLVSLAELNDSGKWTFDALADLLEEAYLGVVRCVEEAA